MSDAAASGGSVYLIGFMGAGKSSVGRVLADVAGLPFFDLDAEIEHRAGRPIARIFAEDGEGTFRLAEREALAVVARGPAAVVACGGGIVLDERNVAIMRETGVIVYLRVSAEEAAARAGESSGRPLLDGEDPEGRARRLLGERAPLYEASATLAVETEARTPRQVAEEIARTLGIAAGAAAGFVLRVGTVPAYEVRVGPGLLAEAGSVLAGLAPSSVALVTDESVAELYGSQVRASIEDAGFEVATIEVPPGEVSKSWDRAGRVLSEMVRAGLDRRSVVVALGGGVVGDLAGFCASTYMRGIPVVQVPTTLLAQVDSAIGGKTGVDLPAGKNLAGTFWQPSAVLADTSCLVTLQESEWRSGLAEVAKSAMLAGEDALAELEADARALEKRDGAAVLRAVRMAAGLKARVVRSDERESGARESLNYGHTFGHALEAVLGYGAVPHGHAVAEGMRFAARMAEQLAGADRALTARQGALLDALGLPAMGVAADEEALMRVMAADKKARGGEIRFVLIRLPGHWETVPVPADVLGEELRAYAAQARGEGER